MQDDIWYRAEHSAGRAGGNRSLLSGLAEQFLESRDRLLRHQAQGPGGTGQKLPTAASAQHLGPLVRGPLGATEQALRALDPYRPDEWRSGGRWSREEIDQRAQRAMRLYNVLVRQGMSREQAAGWAANAEAESGGDYRSRQPGGQGRGLFHWGAARRRAYEQKFRRPFDSTNEQDQLDFMRWELAGPLGREGKKIAQQTTAGDAAEAITRHFERPAATDRDSADRANLAEVIYRMATARRR